MFPADFLSFTYANKKRNSAKIAHDILAKQRSSVPRYTIITLSILQEQDFSSFPYGDEDDDDFEQLVRESEELEPDAPLLY